MVMTLRPVVANDPTGKQKVSQGKPRRPPLNTPSRPHEGRCGSALNEMRFVTPEAMLARVRK